MNTSRSIQFALIIFYIVIGIVLASIGAFPSLVALTFALSVLAPRGGWTVTFAPLKIRVLLALLLLLAALLLLAV